MINKLLYIVLKTSNNIRFFRQIKVSKKHYTTFGIKYSTRDQICDVNYYAPFLHLLP